MASKYDAYWRSRLPALRKCLRAALEEGESEGLALEGLTSLGVRENWRGSVRFCLGQVVGANGAAHLKALGRILADEAPAGEWLEARVGGDLVLRLRRADAAAPAAHVRSPKVQVGHPLGRDTLTRTIHELVWSLPRRSLADGFDGLPDDGIYFMFERGEDTPLGPRIVRVGINKGQGRFRRRLRDHFRGHLYGSVFRRHLAAALSGQGRVHQGAEMEGVVSAYLAQAITFSCLEVVQEPPRKSLEEWLI